MNQLRQNHGTKIVTTRDATERKLTTRDATERLVS